MTKTLLNNTNPSNVFPLKTLSLLTGMKIEQLAKLPQFSQPEKKRVFH